MMPHRITRPTVDEMQRAKPQRSTGAPARCASHKENILALLRERADRGQTVLGSELYADPHRFGRSPRNRISELRQEGHLIEGKPHGSADWEYRLIREDLAPKQDWYEATRGPRVKADTPTDALPLFSEAHR